RRAPHPATVGLADRLVPEAHPEDGDAGAEGADQLHRDPRLGGRLRAGRHHHRGRPALGDGGHRGGVIAHHDAARPQLAQPPDQAEGEGVVVVDNDDRISQVPLGQEELLVHDRRPSAPLSDGHTASAARTRSRSLLSISRASSAGSESATIPAAAWRWSRPWRTTAVRSAIAVSRLPRKSRHPTAPAYAPRTSGSSSAMISMARTLGAPVTVPAGKQARNASTAESPERSFPWIEVSRCMTLA